MAKQRRRVPPGREAEEQGQQAQVPGRCDARFCTKEFYDYMMAQMPKGAIPADMTKHAAHNSYSPLFWYQDYEFVCRDCGKSELWTAEAQRWWYEEAKGPIQSRAVRCRGCRAARRASQRGTPRRSHGEGSRKTPNRRRHPTAAAARRFGLHRRTHRPESWDGCTPSALRRSSLCGTSIARHRAFGAAGKLLTDMDDNRYLVEDIDACRASSRPCSAGSCTGRRSLLQVQERLRRTLLARPYFFGG
jgi:hypothetical protein